MWYPYPYPYPSTKIGTRTRVPIVVPVPVFQHGLVPVLVPIPISLYPYPYLYRGTSTRTHTHISAQLGTHTYGLVPVPVLGSLLIPGTHNHKICEPKLLCFNYSGTPASALYYTLYSCLWVCKPISTMLRQYRHLCKVC